MWVREQVRERDDWNVKPGGKYYFTRYVVLGFIGRHHMLMRYAGTRLLSLRSPFPRNGSLVQVYPSSPLTSTVLTSGYGNHLSFPRCPYTHASQKIRPVSKKTGSGYLQVGVETYGGGLWHTWFDRDLSLAGRVVVANKESGFTSKLIKIDRPLLRVPTLAIHRRQILDLRSTSAMITYSHFSIEPLLVDRNSAADFKFNPESEFIPILGLVASELNAAKDGTQDKSSSEQKEEKHDATSIQKYHHSSLLSVLAEELSVQPEEIHDFELYVHRYP